MKNSVRSKAYRNQSGFTLIEVLVVVVILGILGAIIAPKIMGRPEQARMVKVKQDILGLESALDMYKLDNGIYPTTEQGLAALATKPTVAPLPRDWKEDGYVRSIPIDPWGMPYEYALEDGKVKIFSYGPEGKDGNSEIGNWNLNGEQTTNSGT